MKINNRGNILEIEDARIIFRNFAGVGSKYNREGDRNFAVIIPNEDIKDQLVADGWTVKIKFNNRGPAAYVVSGDQVTKLNEDTIDMLDEIDIQSVDMDIRPYDWEVNGKEGRSAYLQAINVIQNIDRFGAKYANKE